MSAKMLQKEAYFRTALREELARRQRANPAYSLRAFAKQLGMQAPTLSAVLAGKRPLSAATAETLPEKLSFSPSEKKRFLSSLYYRNAPAAIAQEIEASQSARILREELHFKIIAEWEHYAILTLAETKGFRADKKWITRRLGIAEARAQVALTHLMEAGLLSVDATGKARLHQINVNTSDDMASTALRQSHREALAMGADKLEKIPVEKRDFSSMTIAVSMNRMKEAKNLIRSFQKQLSELLEDGARTEVYQLCVQLYPLTELLSEGDGK
jgi:uncharacterized protein (TIGR02147 family)